MILISTARPLLAFFLLISLSTYSSQAQEIKNILLDNTGLLYQPCEPSIAINPKNPDNIVGGAILNKVYYTLDGGKNWETSKLRSSYGVSGDPCIIAA